MPRTLSRTLHRPGIWVCALLAALILPGLYSVTRDATPASAGSGLVPSGVRTDLPVALDGVVTDIEQVGNRIVVAGTFTQVAPQAGEPAVAQRYLYAYDIDTGEFDAAFDPQIDRDVEQIVPDPDGSGLWVVGAFNNIDDVKRRKIARLNADGSLDEAFTANADAKASAVAVSPDGNRLFVGGQFTMISNTPRAGLAELDANTGAVDPGWTIGIEGGIGVGGTLNVKGLAVTPDSRSVIVMASAQKIGGLDRFGLAKVSIQGDTARMQNWRTRLFENNMDRAGGQFWFRGFDMSPDGSYFVITTSGGDRPPTNDVAIRFPVRGNGSDDVQPAWITRNFDSTYSAAIDDDVVYIGGHFQYTEAPGATDPYPGDPERSYGFGGDVNASVLGDQTIARQQIAALDPATGQALGWNPGANGFNGVYALEIIDRGLLLGHDGNIVADKEVGRHGFFDRANPGNGGGGDGNGGGDDGPDPTVLDTTITDPLTGQQFSVGDSITVAGEGTAPEGLQKVQVTVFDLGRRVWLRADGSWGDWAGLEADLVAGEGATSSAWSFTFEPSADGEYEVKAKTFDLARGKDATQASIRLRVNATTEDLKPNTSLLQVGVQEPGNVLDFSGTATDDFGVSRVRTEIVFRDTGQYLQPDGTLGNYHAFDVPVDNPGATGVNWEYSTELDNGAWIIYFIAIDSAGQRDDSAARHSRTIAVGDEKPTEMTIDTPEAEQEFIAGETFTITGAASDDIGIEAVTVRVLNLATGQGILSTGEVGVIDGAIRHNPATLADPGAPTTTWSYPVTAELPPGRYQINAIARDASSQSLGMTIYIVVRAAEQDALPEAYVTGPEDLAILDADIVASGNATDDNGVSRVEVGFYFYGNDDEKAGWLPEDGGATVNVIKYRDAVLADPGAVETDWEYPITLPHEGRWQIRVRAWDNAGQPSTTYRTRVITFQPNDLPPEVTLENFETGAVVASGPLALNGVITDDVSVQRVRYYVRRKTVNEGPNPNTELTTAGWFDGFVTQPGGTRSNFTITTEPLDTGNWFIYVQGYDKSGQVTERHRFDFVVTPDEANEAPIAKVVTPKHWTVDTPSLDMVATGTVTDDVAVESVQVLIYDATERKYYTPAGEYTSESALAYWTAELAAPGTASTEWSLPVVLPQSGRYNMYAFAYDNQGMRQTDNRWGHGLSGFWVTPGDARPVNTTLSPVTGDVLTGPTLSVNGVATDDFGVTQIRVLIRNADDFSKGLRPDGTVTEGGQWITATDVDGLDTTEATWRFEAELPAGRWRIDVIAYDETTKYTHAPAQTITIEDPAQ